MEWQWIYKYYWKSKMSRIGGHAEKSFFLGCDKYVEQKTFRNEKRRMMHVFTFSRDS